MSLIQGSSDAAGSLPPSPIVSALRTDRQVMAKKRIENSLADVKPLIKAKIQSYIGQVSDKTLDYLQRRADNQIASITIKAHHKIDELYSNPTTPRRAAQEVKKIRMHALREAGQEIAKFERDIIKESMQTEMKDHLEYNPDKLDSYTKDLMESTKKGIFLKAVAKLGEFKTVRNLMKVEDNQYAHPQPGIRGWFRNVVNTVNCFNKSVNKLSMASEKPLKSSSEPKIFQDQENEYIEDRTRTYKRLNGVIATPETVRAALVTKPKEALKQLNTFTAQRLTMEKREIIERPFTVTPPSTEITYKFNTKGVEVKNTIVPVNRHFDEKFGPKGSSTYANLYGDYGVSSTFHQSKHATNLYFDSMSIGKTDMHFYRHGILSARTDKDPAERDAIAKQKAKELLQAPFEAYLGKTGKSIDQLASESISKPIKQYMVSVSIVTPDLPRELQKGSSSEANMLRDQIHGLMSNSGETTYKVGDKLIYADVKVIAFNYGVNIWAKERGMGWMEQAKTNNESLKELEVLINSSQKPGAKPRTAEQHRASDNVRRLMEDIRLLNKSPWTYREGSNQYEVGAKLVCLANELRILGNTDVADMVDAAVNCMSGKDRTGAMGAVIKTFQFMRQEMGRYPSHRDLEKNVNGVQDRFVEVSQQMYENYGGLEITGVNTGVEGYKLDGTGKLYPKSKVWKRLGDAFENIRGLGVTTGS